MARKVAKKLPRVHEMIDMKTENLMPAVPKKRFPFGARRIALVVLVLGIIGVLYANKGLFIAAVVDGKPIFRWELNQVLSDRFGQQTLDGMISEYIVDGEAKKQGVVVTQAEIDTKVKEVVASLGGASLDELLKYQGTTKAEFEKQIRLQLLVEKMLGRDVTVTDEEVAEYAASNAATLTATDEAGIAKEARAAITSQKINEKLQAWFGALRTKAKIMRFI